MRAAIPDSGFEKVPGLFFEKVPGLFFAELAQLREIMNPVPFLRYLSWIARRGLLEDGQEPVPDIGNFLGTDGVRHRVIVPFDLVPGLLQSLVRVLSHRDW